jgi:pimeloyl-ACP methyl ester carboxylesterase
MGGGTYAGMSIYDTLKGDPFSEEHQRMPQGQDVYIGIAGAGTPGPQSNFYYGMMETYGKDNVAMFRWCDRKQIRKFLDEAHKQGKRIHVVGHSYGAATAMQEIKRSGVPIESVTTSDPVSWTGRVYDKPHNVKQWQNYTPGNLDMTDWSNLVSVIGGRWGDSTYNTVPALSRHAAVVIPDK